MKRRESASWWIVALFLLTVVLVACERPLQDDVSPQEGTTAPLDTPAETEGETIIEDTPLVSTPGLQPTPTSALPEATSEPSEPAAGEESATAEPEATEAPPTEEETVEQPAEDVVHTVVAGDTLNDIAERYGVTVEAIAQANDLASIHTLDVGQQLLIPLSGDVPAEDEGTGEEEAAGAEQVHVVRAGETLFRIGQAYGFTVEELATYNNLTNPDRLEVGQEILIPPQGYSVDQ